MNKKTILYLALLIISTQVQAQSILTQQTRWESSASIHLNTGDSLLLPVNFISDETSIKMIQGELITVFTIDSFEGSWNTPDTTGQLVCQIRDNSATPGIITLGRDSEGLYMILDMTPGNPDGISRRFIIHHYQVN